MNDAAEGKKCSKCSVWKPLPDFVAGSKYKSGYAATCKECHNSQNRASRAGFSTCTECKQRKPRSEFATKRICTDCKTHKVCKICGERLPLTAFDGYHGLVCRPCRKQADSERYQADRDRVLARNADWRKLNAQPDSAYRQRQRRIQAERRTAIHRAVYQHYGNRCECCGETERVFLTIDHIDGNGAQHRRETGKMDIAYWLYMNGMPEGFRILCYNCNAGRYRNGGTCPHEAKRAAVAE